MQYSRQILLKLYLLFFLLHGSIINIYAQSGTKGVGYSSYYRNLIDEGTAKNEALLNAQKNALIAYGGSVNIKTNCQQSEITKGSKNDYNSNFHIAARQIMNAMVKAINEPTYTYEHDGKKKYIIAESRFEIHIKEFENLVNLYINATGKKIRIELKSIDCNSIYPILREYFNLKQNNFQFADNNGVFNTQDVFVINVFRDHIDFTKKQFKNNKFVAGPILKTFMFKTYYYQNCQDFVNKYNRSDGNQIFNELMSEFYKGYITDNISDF